MHRIKKIHDFYRFKRALLSLKTLRTQNGVNIFAMQFCFNNSHEKIQLLRFPTDLKANRIDSNG